MLTSFFPHLFVFFCTGITVTARRMKKIVTIILTARHNNPLLLADCKGEITRMGVGGDCGQ